MSEIIRTYSSSPFDFNNLYQHLEIFRLLYKDKLKYNIIPNGVKYFNSKDFSQYLNNIHNEKIYFPEDIKEIELTNTPGDLLITQNDYIIPEGINTLTINLGIYTYAIKRNKESKIYLPYNYQNLNIIFNDIFKTGTYFAPNTFIILPNILLEKDPFYIANYIEKIIKSVKLNNPYINSKNIYSLLENILCFEIKDELYQLREYYIYNSYITKRLVKTILNIKDSINISNKTIPTSRIDKYNTLTKNAKN